MDTERSIRGVWKGDWVCDVAFDQGTFRVDEPTSVPLGTDQGPQPTELLLGAVSSCFTLAVAYAARKRSVALTSLAVTATGVYDGPSFSSIRIDAEVGCPEGELDRLLKSAERVCYVTNTLRGGVELTISGTVVS